MVINYKKKKRYSGKTIFLNVIDDPLFRFMQLVFKNIYFVKSV